MRTVVMGAGRMGRRHIRAAQELGLELVGVCDRRPEALALAAEECGLPAAVLFTDSQAMLQVAAPECAIVATTADSHQGLTTEALRNGARYLLCEKPMASSIAQCDAMIRDCEAHGAKLAINHHFRFSGLFQAIKSTLSSETLGGVSSVTVVAANVGMAMIGTHMFELFQVLTGEAPDEVTGWLTGSGSPNPRGAQFDDPVGAIRITTRSGKRFYMEAEADQGHGITVTYGARYGQMQVDLLSGVVRTVVRLAEDRNLPNTRYGTQSVQSMAKYSPADAVGGTKALLNNLLTGGEYPTGEEARDTVAILAAAYVSSESGHRPIRVDDRGLPRERVFPWP